MHFKYYLTFKPRLGTINVPGGGNALRCQYSPLNQQSGRTMKLESQVKYRRASSKGKRFYTGLDMAIIKKAEEELNSRVKRGELVRKGNRYISVCGCGAEGCFVHGSYESKTKPVTI
jgi:hypothetical protein